MSRSGPDSSRRYVSCDAIESLSSILCLRLDLRPSRAHDDLLPELAIQLGRRECWLFRADSLRSIQLASAVDRDTPVKDRHCVEE